MKRRGSQPSGKRQLLNRGNPARQAPEPLSFQQEKRPGRVLGSRVLEEWEERANLPPARHAAERAGAGAGSYAKNRVCCSTRESEPGHRLCSQLGGTWLNETILKKKRKKQFLNLCPFPARWDGTGLPHGGRGVGRKISDLWPSSRPSLEIKESSCPEPRR